MSTDELLARLEEAGDRFAAADKAREEALAELGEAMRAAQGEVPVAQMARLGQVSRVTVYRLLEK